jgi:hypothetical protein
MRILLPIVRFFLKILVYFLFDRPLNKVRQTVGLNEPLGLFTRYQGKLILVNSAFGLEYTRYMPPHIQLTGPMVDMTIPIDHYTSELNMDDRSWIEFDSKPVVYVSAGTTVPLSKTQVDKLLLSLSSDRFRVTWKLNAKDAVHLPQSNDIPKSIRIIEWASSAKGHFAHPNFHITLWY